MIDAQNTTTTLYSYQNGIGANTEAILNRTLRHILYGDLYDGGGNGGNGGSDEHWDKVVALLHFDAAGKASGAEEGLFASFQLLGERGGLRGQAEVF